MAQKVSPISFRLGINKTWKSKWFSDIKKKYRHNVLEDIKLRQVIRKKLKHAAVATCEIDRGPEIVKLTIHSSRPGVIIGRNGVGTEELKKEIQKLVGKDKKVEISIQEIKNPESNAALIAQIMAEQIEKRISYRRVMKRAIDRAIQSEEVKGVKVMVSGRLDGVDIARSEWLARGKIPLHTLRANVNFAEAEAFTTYGVVGIKVWIYKGEVFK